MIRVIREYGSDYFRYNNKTYECKWVEFRGSERLIAPVSLLDALARDRFEGSAGSIDDEIYAYADDEFLYGDEGEFVRYLDNHFD